MKICTGMQRVKHGFGLFWQKLQAAVLIRIPGRQPDIAMVICHDMKRYVILD